MKIEVVHISERTNAGKHLSLAAWQNSRPTDDDTDLDKILGIDIPVNEMPTAILNIESTIIEREIIATMRDHVMWARSSRVDPIHKWRIDPEHFEKAPEEYVKLKRLMLEQMELGERQDLYRMLTPVMSNTNYTIRISLRSLVQLARYFLFLANLELPISYLFHSAFVTTTGVIGLLSPNVRLSLDSTKGYQINQPIEYFESGRVGDTIVITEKMPFSLRTHIVRHRPFIIRDNFLDFISRREIAGLTIAEPMTVQMSADVGFWKQIAKKRSCWMAQYDLWEPILSKIEQYTSMGIDSLPCSDGSCPYRKDAELRGSDQYPGAQCPRYLQLEKREATQPENMAILTQIQDEGRPDFWKDILWSKKS